MFELDHVAIQSADVPALAKYYVDTFHAQILYSDDTWAFLKVGQGKLAIVRPDQHPPHIALRVDTATLDTLARNAEKHIDHHRDGTTGIYLNDPAGNVLELICYPEMDPP